MSDNIKERFRAGVLCNYRNFQVVVCGGIVKGGALVAIIEQITAEQIFNVPMGDLLLVIDGIQYRIRLRCCFQAVMDDLVPTGELSADDFNKMRMLMLWQMRRYTIILWEITSEEDREYFSDERFGRSLSEDEKKLVFEEPQVPYTGIWNPGLARLPDEAELMKKIYAGIGSPVFPGH